MASPLGKRQANAFGTGAAHLGPASRTNAFKKPKSLPFSWWEVPEEKFAEAAAAERARLMNVESPPIGDKWGCE